MIERMRAVDPEAVLVAKSNAGMPELVIEGETGLLVPYDDDDALAAALVRILRDASLRERLGAHGIAWAARFTWPDCAARSLDALTAALPAAVAAS